MARKAPRKPDGRRTKVTKRQLKVIQARAEGKTLKESGEAAGYSPKNAAQSAYQALAGLRGRMTALLDEAGLGERRVLLKSLVMIHDNRIRISDYVDAGATELLAAVRSVTNP